MPLGACPCLMLGRETRSASCGAAALLEPGGFSKQGSPRLPGWLECLLHTVSEAKAEARGVGLHGEPSRGGLRETGAREPGLVWALQEPSVAEQVDNKHEHEAATGLGARSGCACHQAPTWAQASM